MWQTYFLRMHEIKRNVAIFALLQSDPISASIVIWIALKMSETNCFRL